MIDRNNGKNVSLKRQTGISLLKLLFVMMIPAFLVLAWVLLTLPNTKADVYLEEVEGLVRFVENYEEHARDMGQLTAHAAGRLDQARDRVDWVEDSTVVDVKVDPTHLILYLSNRSSRECRALKERIEDRSWITLLVRESTDENETCAETPQEIWMKVVAA